MPDRIRLVSPIPFRENYGPTYTRDRGDRNYDFAFAFRDAQGMPGGPGGARVHGGIDMFADGGDPVAAPVTGRIVRSEGGGGVVGQVFGGVVAVEAPEGHAVLMRHVNPTVPLGAAVNAGETIATVTPWQSGWPHAHVEVYRFWPAGYDFRNTIDPRAGVEWVSAAEAAPEPIPDYFFEELPHTEGGLGPAIVWHGRGSTAAAAAFHKLRYRTVSTVRDADGVGYVLWWLPGTYPGGLPIFGPWLEDGAREAKATARERNTGRTMRRFRGRIRSLYPIPAV
jgi:murein DD-endopeptidase MepM/ murein hydrolase activator NlpD